MCKKRFIFLNIVILILFTGYSVAREIKEVNFTGKVTDTKGNPIAGAKVTVYEMHSDGVAGNILLQQVGEATTTENGRFLIVIPLPIKNTLMDGYIVAQKDGLSLGWTTLNMREDTDIDIKLGEPQQLQGVVVNLEGNPVAGAQVGVNLYQIETNSEGEAKKQWLPGIAPL
jgi:protocatechuate 3,4-dioxygenase beta subunit